jgi:hypothetical protein
MRKLNITLLTIVLSVCFACNNEIKTEENIQEKSTKKSFQDFSKETYKGQMIYISKAENENDDIAEMSLDYDFEFNLRDKSVSWEFFDKIYNDDLYKSEKQCLAFNIMSIKDLIGLYNKDKNNEVLEKKLLFYTQLLVDTDYIGYCLLYYSFDALKDKYPEKIIEFKNKVAKYSVNDEFHKKTLADKDLEKSEMAVFYKKAKENFSYLEKIKTLK